MSLSPPAVERPTLPYARGALVPHISEEAVTFHFDKHHLGYYNKLAAALPGTEWDGAALEDIVRGADGAIYNNAAQIWNHSFYWDSMSPSGGGAPSGAIAAAIDRAFGSFEAFKEQFSAAAAGHFGSGWAWLVRDSAGQLAIAQTHDAGCPLRDGRTPLLACDVWEHAYYIDFRNDRAAYIASWWSVVNWEFANLNLGGECVPREGAWPFAVRATLPAARVRGCCGAGGGEVGTRAGAWLPADPVVTGNGAPRPLPTAAGAVAARSDSARLRRSPSRL